jgi:hypothetical protein
MRESNHFKFGHCSVGTKVNPRNKIEINFMLDSASSFCDNVFHYVKEHIDQKWKSFAWHRF